MSITRFITGGNPNAFQASNVGNNGATLVAPLHIHNAAPIAGVFPLAGNPARSRGASVTFITPQQSRVGIETRTPTGCGEASILLSFDMSNGNSFLPGNNAQISTNDLVPRLLNAYATLGAFSAGRRTRISGI